MIERKKIHELVYHNQSERFAPKFNSWEHFLTMLLCQIAQAKSLREICGGLACCVGKMKHLVMQNAPNKSTLSYANIHRPWEMFQDLFFEMLATCKTSAPGKHEFRFKNKLLSLDSTTMLLCLSFFSLARFRRTKRAVKGHLLLDYDGYMPSCAYISNGKKHDVCIARKIFLSPNSIITMDSAYNYYRLFALWIENGIYFVSRLKSNAGYCMVQEFNIPKNRNIFSGQVTRFSGPVSHKQCPHIMRNVVVWDAINKQQIVLGLLTNHLKFDATTISAIYNNDRWQIELFFKALKQNLKVKTLWGTSENALYIQIWTALIAMLMVKFLPFRSRFGCWLSN